MSTAIVMPKAGLTMVEGTIAEWKVAEGAYVKKGDVLMEYENEKNTIDCEALGEGYVHIIAKEGDTIPVGEVIGMLAESEAELAQLAGKLKDMGENIAYEQVMQAVSDFEKGNMRLSTVLAALNA